VNGRIPSKETSSKTSFYFSNLYFLCHQIADRSRTPNHIVSMNRSNAKVTTTREPGCPSSSVTTSLNK